MKNTKQTNQRKQYAIVSPAYRDNGFGGRYVSYAETDANGKILFGIGDHFFKIDGKEYFKVKGYSNIAEIEGLPFSDSDRFIRTHPVSTCASIARKYRDARKQYAHDCDVWEKGGYVGERPTWDGGLDYYAFCRKILSRIPPAAQQAWGVEYLSAA